MEGQRIISAILNSLIFSHVTCFMTGAPDWSCKDPSAFHTLRLNASHEGIIMPQDMKNNPYAIDVDVSSFNPGSTVKVTIRGTSNDTISGFFLQAIQANMPLKDIRRQAFGRFLNITENERPSVCQPVKGIPRGGATHSRSGSNENVSVIWLAPEQYNPGEIQFLATVVKDYSTYYTDARSTVIRPEGYESKKDLNSFHWTPTASWYRWLQYLYQQQLLQGYTNSNSNQKSSTAKQKEDNPINSPAITKKNEITVQKVVPKPVKDDKNPEVKSKLT